MGVLDFVELSTHRDYVLFGHGKFRFGFLSLFVDALDPGPLLAEGLKIADSALDVGLGIGVHGGFPT